MPEFGTSLGLAAKVNLDQQINDLYHFEQLHRQQQAANEAKARMFADDLDYTNAANAYDNPIVKRNALKKIGEIVQLVKDNPNWQTDIGIRSMINQKKKELKDNPDLTRALMFKNQQDAYLKDLQEVAKNPQAHDVEAYQDYGRRLKNYEQFGHGEGLEGLKREGAVVPLYTKPRDFSDLNERWKNIGNGFKDLVAKPIKGGRNAYEEIPRKESLQRVAEQEYVQNKRQYDLEAQKQGVNPIEYIKTGINAHIPKKRDFGDYGLSDALYLQQYKNRGDGLDRNTGSNAYQDAFVNAKEGVVNPKFLEQTYDTKPRNIIYDNKGQNQIDNTGNKVFYTGVHKWVKRQDNQGKEVPQKVVEVYSYLNKDDAEQKGIYDNGTFGFGKGISSNWDKQAEVVTTYNDKGEPVEVIKVKSLLPVEINSAYAGAFNNEAHIAKSKLMSEKPVENQGAGIGSIITNKNTGKSYRVVEGGYEPID